MNAKNMSDYESQEENDEIILKLKDLDKQPKKDKSRRPFNPILAKLDPVVENSKLYFIISRWKKDQNPKEKIGL